MFASDEIQQQMNLEESREVRVEAESMESQHWSWELVVRMKPTIEHGVLCNHCE